MFEGLDSGVQTALAAVLLGGSFVAHEWYADKPFFANNFYNRASPFRVAINHNGVAYQYVQQGLFGFIPSISYNFDLNL